MRKGKFLKKPLNLLVQNSAGVEVGHEEGKETLLFVDQSDQNQELQMQPNFSEKDGEATPLSNEQIGQV